VLSQNKIKIMPGTHRHLSRKIKFEIKATPSTVAVKHCSNSSTPSTVLQQNPPSVTYINPSLGRQCLAVALSKSGEQITLECELNTPGHLTITSLDGTCKKSIDTVSHRQIIVLHDNKQVITYKDNKFDPVSDSFTVWDINNARKVRDVTLPYKGILSIAATQDGKNLAVLSNENSRYTLSLCDTENYAHRAHFDCDGVSYSVHASSLTNELLVASSKGCQKFKVENDQLKSIGTSTAGQCGDVIELPDGRLAVAGQRFLTIWNNKKLNNDEYCLLARLNISDHQYSTTEYLVHIPSSNLIYVAVKNNHSHQAYIYLLHLSDRHHVRILNKATLKHLLGPIGKNEIALTAENHLITSAGERVEFKEVTDYFRDLELERLQRLQNEASLPSVLATMTLGFLTNPVKEQKSERTLAAPSIGGRKNG
jgi:hypothetical protein